MIHPATQADVIRYDWPVEVDKSVNLYLGTGRCGGCFDRYGLQHQDDFSPVAKSIAHEFSGRNVQLIEGADLLDSFAGLTCDLVHPSTEGHTLMAENLAARLRPLIPA